MIKTSGLSSPFNPTMADGEVLVKEIIPPLDKSLIPEGITIPSDIWEKIYLVLHEAPRHMLKPNELNVAFSRMWKKSLGGKDLLNKCHVRNLTSLICALPDVEPFRTGGDWYYHLRDRNSLQPRIPYRDRVSRMESKPKKYLEYSEPSTDDDIAGDDAEDYELPSQPIELLPRGARLPNDLRQRIYKLLNFKYRQGIPIDKFREDYAKTYGLSIKNQRDCSLSEEELFHALRDCVASMKGKDDKLWIKPRTVGEINQIHEERPAEIFNAPPVLPVKENAKTRYCNQINPARGRYIKLDMLGASTSNALKNMKRSSTEPSIVPKQQMNVASAFTDEQVYRTNSSSSISKPSLNYLMNSNICSKSARENKRNVAAEKKMRDMDEDSFSTNFYKDAANAYVSRPPKAESPLNEFNDIELLSEALMTLKNWINYDDLESFFHSKYRREMILPKNLNLLQALNRRPELFVFSDALLELSVRARRYITGNFVDTSQIINPQIVVDFGLTPSDVFSGSLDCLQLEIGEEIEVMISFVTDCGEFYVQMVAMEPAYRDLEYDMNQFYSDSDQSAAFEITADYIKIGFPLAFCLSPNWHRGETVDIKYYDNSREIFQVYVRDVDFGQCHWVSKKFVRFLKRDFVENRAPPCAIFCVLAYILPDPHKWANNSRDVIVEYSRSASSMWIKVVSLIAEDKTPEVYLVAYYGQEQPEVDVNEEMVKRSLAIYLNGARERRENDNDLAVDDDDLTSDATAGRMNLNRFMSIDTNYGSERSSITSTTSTTSDNVEGFNRYGPEAMALAMVRSKSENRSASSTTGSYAMAQALSSVASNCLYGTSSATSPVENSFYDESNQSTSTNSYDNFRVPSTPSRIRNYLQTPLSIDNQQSVRNAPKTTSTPSKLTQNLDNPSTPSPAGKTPSSVTKKPVDKRAELMDLLGILNGALQNSTISEDLRLIYGSQVDEIMKKLDKLDINETAPAQNFSAMNENDAVSNRVINSNLNSAKKQNSNASSTSSSCVERSTRSNSKVSTADDVSWTCSLSSSAPLVKSGAASTSLSGQTITMQPTTSTESEFDGVIDTSTAFRLPAQADSPMFTSPIVADPIPSTSNVYVSPVVADGGELYASGQDPYVSMDAYHQAYYMQHRNLPPVHGHAFYPAAQHFMPPSNMMPYVNGYYQMPQHQVVIREVHYVPQPMPAPYCPGAFGGAPFYYGGPVPPRFSGPALPTPPPPSRR